MEKKETKKITIVIEPEIHKKLNELGYNGNKLVNKLLKEYLQNKGKEK